jgi:hypothetical protein
MKISNKDMMNKAEKETKKNKYINALTNQFKKKINEDFNISYQELTKNKNEIKKKDIEKWKNNILITINKEIDNFIEQIKEKENVNEAKNKNEYKMESNTELNMFTPKDIQEENKEITRNFQNEAYNYLNTNEKIENEKIAYFLKNVGEISRISYNKANILYNIMQEKFLNLKENLKKSFENENTIKKFSCWIKKIENEKGNIEYQNFFNSIKLFDKDEKNDEQKFLRKLFHDLTLMYFHCFISFPLVEINFKIKGDDFDSEKMIDFINRGKNRKVNFVILPSLFSFGSFLQNGKAWVFTFSKNTFKFDDSINDFLNKCLGEEEGSDSEIIELIKNKFTMKVYCKYSSYEKEIIIDTNMDIPQNIDYEFHFYLIDKRTGHIFIQKIKEKKLKISNCYEINRYEFILQDKLIISGKNIIKI